MNQTVKTALVIVTLLFTLAVIVYGLGDALLPLFIAFSLAYLVFPLIKRLETKGIRRHHAVLGVFTMFILMFGLTLVLVIPGLVSDANAFIEEFPQSSARALDRIEDFAGRFNYNLDLSTTGIKTYILTHTSDLSAGFLKGFSTSLLVVFSGVAKLLISILSFFLIPLFFFYAINDYEKITAEVKSFVPKSLRPKLQYYMVLSNRVLSGFIRGQLLVAMLLGCLYAIGLFAVGLRFGILIGIVSGLLSIIPYAGLTIGFSTALLVALANQASSGMLVGVVLVFLAVQALEGTVITPKLVGDKVGLSPLATMLALIIGGNLMGLTGMLLAIPIAAIAKSILVDLKREYLALEIFKP